MRQFRQFLRDLDAQPWYVRAAFFLVMVVLARVLADLARELWRLIT